MRGRVQVPAQRGLFLPGCTPFEGLANLQRHGLRRDAGGLGGSCGVNFPFHSVWKGGEQLTDLLTIGDAGLVAGEIIFSGDLGHAELHAVFAAAQQSFKSIRSLELDEVIRVLLHRFAIHQAAGQLQNLDGELRLVQNLQGPLCGNFPGVVIVIAEHQLLGETGEKPGLLHRQRRAHGGHGVVKARLVQCHNIQVPLTENHIGTLGLFCQVQSIQNPAFAVNRRLRGVHIFGFGFVQHPAAKSHHVAAGIHHRQHEPVPEFVIEAAVFILNHQARLQQLRFCVALFRHGGQQHIPGVGRGAHAKFDCGSLSYLAAAEIFPHRFPLRLLQELIIEAGGVPVQVQQPLATAALLPVSRICIYVHRRACARRS